MTEKRKMLMFGNPVEVPEDSAEAVVLGLEVERAPGVAAVTINCYLKVAFVARDIRIEEKFLIARRAKGFCSGDEGYFNKKLYELLMENGFSEKEKGELALFIMGECKKGEVKEENMRNKLKKIFDLKG
jgi:hypothetical protein